MDDEPLLSKRTFIAIFIVLVIIAVGGAAFSKFNEKISTQPSPSPSTEDLIFNSQKSQQNPNQIAPDNPSQTRQIKQYPKAPQVLPNSELSNKKAIIQTNKGIIEFEIFPDSPKAASNFIFLASDKFYDGLTFHRVESGFVIQGGDPLGNGAGGPGYKFEDEPVTKKYLKGIVAMANAGPNTNGSQFFIMLDDNENLPPNYTIFGEVIKGQEIVEKIAVGDVMKSVTIEPLE